MTDSLLTLPFLDRRVNNDACVNCHVAPSARHRSVCQPCWYRIRKERGSQTRRTCKSDACTNAALPTDSLCRQCKSAYCRERRRKIVDRHQKGCFSESEGERKKKKRPIDKLTHRLRHCYMKKKLDAVSTNK